MIPSKGRATSCLDDSASMHTRGAISDDIIQELIERHRVRMIAWSTGGALLKVPNGSLFHIGSLLYPFYNKYF